MRGSGVRSRFRYDGPPATLTQALADRRRHTMDVLGIGGLTLERAIAEVTCPRCKQPAGSPCKTPGGRLAPCHSPRYELAKLGRRERGKLGVWKRSGKGGPGPGGASKPRGGGIGGFCG